MAIFYSSNINYIFQPECNNFSITLWLQKYSHGNFKTKLKFAELQGNNCFFCMKFEVSHNGEVNFKTSKQNILMAVKIVN